MKRTFKIGMIAGFFVGVVVSLSMDIVFKDALGGSWADAVSHDLSLLFGRPLSPNSFIVIMGVFIVIGLVGLIGAFIGGVVGVFLYRLFSLLKN
ncbi:MAG: hypothetical protein N2257_10110 [Thermodesulfovibrionales bacterium]|nr:hypothetical protein [Thermodesulfovibrionales bacterium]